MRRRPPPPPPRPTTSAPTPGARLISSASTTPSRRSRPPAFRSSGSACRRSRSGRNAGDIPFLNELYRSRADKAGIVYVDVWDGFVDDDGRFAQSGPDFEGQTRRLRSGDGVYFTQPGARKLAHFVEKEIDRWLTARPVALAVPADEPKAAAPAPAGIAPAAAPGKAEQH